MNKQTNNRGVLIFVLFFIVWAFAMYCFKDYRISDLVLYTTLACGSISFIICMVYAAGIFTPFQKTNEMQHVPLIYLSTYLLVSLIVNFGLSFTDQKILHIIFFNVVMLCICIALVYYSQVNASNIEYKVQTVENNMSAHTLRSQKMGEALALAHDPKVKKRLLELKTLFDYSNAFETPETQTIDSRLNFQLDALNTLLDTNAGTDKVLAKIDEITTDVSFRNTLK